MPSGIHFLVVIYLSSAVVCFLTLFYASMKANDPEYVELHKHRLHKYKSKYFAVTAILCSLLPFANTIHLLRRVVFRIPDIEILEEFGAPCICSKPCKCAEITNENDF